MSPSAIGAETAATTSGSAATTKNHASTGTTAEPGVWSNEVELLHSSADPEDINDKHAAAFADYDGDGRRDLFVTGGGGGGRGSRATTISCTTSWRTTSRTSRRRGMTNKQGSGRFVLWFDYDRNGTLDAYVGHFLRPVHREENRNKLWHNDAGHFRDVAQMANVGEFGQALSGESADLDGNDYRDLIVVPQSPTRLYVNRGDGTFKRESLGVDLAESVAAGDYDNDGDLDLFISRGRRNGVPQLSKLLRHDTGGT